MDNWAGPRRQESAKAIALDGVEVKGPSVQAESAAWPSREKKPLSSEAEFFHHLNQDIARFLQEVGADTSNMDESASRIKLTLNVLARELELDDIGRLSGRVWFKYQRLQDSLT